MVKINLQKTEIANSFKDKLVRALERNTVSQRREANKDSDFKARSLPRAKKDKGLEVARIE